MLKNLVQRGAYRFVSAGLGDVTVVHLPDLDAPGFAAASSEKFLYRLHKVPQVNASAINGVNSQEMTVKMMKCPRSCVPIEISH